MRGWLSLVGFRSASVSPADVRFAGVLSGGLLLVLAACGVWPVSGGSPCGLGLVCHWSGVCVDNYFQFPCFCGIW